MSLRPQLLADLHDERVDRLPWTLRKHREHALPFFVL
jgi:hypothetical protein